MDVEAKSRSQGMTPTWGEPLEPRDYDCLGASWISPEIADAALLRRVNAHQGREIVGQKGNRDCSGILISYYWPGDAFPFCHRIRRDNPDLETAPGGKIKQTAKYCLLPAGLTASTCLQA